MEDSAPSQKQPLWLKAFTAIALAVMAFMIAMPFIFKGGDAVYDDIVIFFGRFHPVALHMPIGLISLVALFEGLNMLPFLKKKFETTFILFLAAVSSVVAILLGFALYRGEGHSGEIGDDHLWGGIIFGCVVIAALLLKMWAARGGFLKMAGTLAVFAAMPVLGWAAHHGGMMVHGTNYMTKYAPEWLPEPIYMALGDGSRRDVKGVDDVAAIPDVLPAEGPVFTSVIMPILEPKCLYCHAEEESVKGKFRMETVDLMIAGGRSKEPGIVRGDAAASHMMQRIHLPLDDPDEEHMPPADKDQLEEHEIAILEWWINAGAPEGETDSVVSLGAPADIIESANKILPPEVLARRAEEERLKKEAEKKAAEERRKELAGAMEKLQKDFPGALNFESLESTDLTFTAVSMRSKFTDADLEKLSPVADGIVSLELSATSVTDTGVENIVAGMPKLRSLKLNETAVTDQSIETIKTLKDLKSLNLYGTQVTDAGVMGLKDLEYLKRVYLWNSKVTPAGAEALQKALAGTQADLIKAKTDAYNAASDKDKEAKKLRPGKQPEVNIGL